jgi:hypothetical protein
MIQQSEWSYDLVAHLLDRAGFGGTPAEIERLAAMSPRDAVRSLVYYRDVADVELAPFHESGFFPAPDWSPARTSNAFRHILFGTLDGLPPAERARLMHPAAPERAALSALPGGSAGDRRRPPAGQPPALEPLSLLDGRHETALRELLHLILSTPENQLA